MHLRRDAEQGDQVFVGGYEKGQDACAGGASDITVDCQGIMTLPDMRINLASLQSL